MKGDKNKVYIIFYKGYFSNKNIKNEKGKCINLLGEINISKALYKIIVFIYI